MSSRNVLVVDDDPSVLELLTSVLKRADRHVVGAYDSHTALDEMQRVPYDLVVAGFSRNGIDGLDFLRRTRATHPDARVILTAERADPCRVIHAIRERAYSYFHKPLPPGPMADMVQQALTASGWQDEIEVVSARPEWVTLRVRCKLEAGDRTVQFLKELHSDIAHATREDIAAAFRELLMNSIEHGGGNDENKTVRVSMIRAAKSFIAHIQDPGGGFSLDRMEHAAIGNPDHSPIRHVEVRAEHGQRPGGFGILITRNLVDDLVYNEPGNEVVFIKRLA